ncbi:hypothetical protein N8K70_01215 [Microbacterium betulae]|uniref:Uncharacterized protein n=1 Tax=Microbacterium betulae TaxID=2981139 RepID=A0AA97FHV5_9MICO|nr:DUF6716 putative glycosyltransferase [Microbacterium sp. AB]WOF23320.1 hypothetical protein N8K70_01215 [Microbacterium sp. AB]
MTSAAALRVAAVADSDSYVKWAAALLGASGAEARLLVLATPLTVSDAQLADALEGSGLRPARVRRVSYDELPGSLAEFGADAVLLAARGPLVRVLARRIAAQESAPVLFGGIPGITFPAGRRALLYRVQCDLLVLHSHREVRDFAALAAREGRPQRFGLARLPFAAAGGERRAPGGTDLVFAAQAIVPRERADRVRVVDLLVRAAEADPSRRVVLKLRSVRGERETHPERHAYAELLEARSGRPPNLVVASGPMSRALDSAQGLVTVSSTAAVEAVARGIPVILLDLFGVSGPLVNTVFAGSGLFGDEDAVARREFRSPDPRWLRDNYLHDPAEDDWAERLAALVSLRRRGELPVTPPLARRGGRLRDAWERKRVLGRHDRTASGTVALVIGAPARGVVRMAQRVRRVLRSRAEAPSPGTPV